LTPGSPNRLSTSSRVRSSTRPPPPVIRAMPCPSVRRPSPPPRQSTDTTLAGRTATSRLWYGHQVPFPPQAGGGLGTLPWPRPLWRVDELGALEADIRLRVHLRRDRLRRRAGQSRRRLEHQRGLRIAADVQLLHRRGDVEAEAAAGADMPRVALLRRR